MKKCKGTDSCKIDKWSICNSTLKQIPVNSKHRFVVTRLLILPTILLERHEKNFNKPINYSKIHKKDIQTNYHIDLRQRLQLHNHQDNNSLLRKWNYIVDKILSSSKSALGYCQPNPNNQHHNQEVEQLFNKQKQLRLKVNNCNNVIELMKLKSESSIVLHLIMRETKTENCKFIFKEKSKKSKTHRQQDDFQSSQDAE